jgi:hypothetical protein
MRISIAIAITGPLVAASPAGAVVIHSYASCYFAIWGWCPIESILGSLMLGAIWVAIVLAFRLLIRHFRSKK